MFGRFVASCGVSLVLGTTSFFLPFFGIVPFNQRLAGPPYPWDAVYEWHYWDHCLNRIAYMKWKQVMARHRGQGWEDTMNQLDPSKPASKASALLPNGCNLQVANLQVPLFGGFVFGLPCIVCVLSDLFSALQPRSPVALMGCWITNPPLLNLFQFGPGMRILTPFEPF